MCENWGRGQIEGLNWNYLRDWSKNSETFEEVSDNISQLRGEKTKSQRFLGLVGLLTPKLLADGTAEIRLALSLDSDHGVKSKELRFDHRPLTMQWYFVAALLTVLTSSQVSGKWIPKLKWVPLLASSILWFHPLRLALSLSLIWAATVTGNSLIFSLISRWIRASE